MDIQELANAAAEKVNRGIEHFYLVLPPKQNEGQRRFLDGPNSPSGRFVGSAGDKPGSIVSFKAIDILAWCAANGAKVLTVNEKTGRATSYNHGRNAE